MSSAPNYLFVSNIRFWSMVSIIAIHSICQFPLGPHEQVARDLQFALMQVFKFGTIGLFLISGFLLSKRVDQHTRLQYFLRRWNTIAWPWIFWAGISAIALFTEDQWTRRLGPMTLGRQLLERVDQILFASIYWFIPNMLFCLAILLLFRKYLDSWIFGLTLGAVSLFYAVNAYVSWIPSDHKIAFFGFIFYLWIGNWAARHFGDVTKTLRHITVPMLLVMNLVLCFVAYEEGRYLLEHTRGDPENTLRISNVLFSLSVALTLMKLRPTWPSFLDVRTDTYGLYLIHPLLLKLLRGPIAFIAASVSEHALGSAGAVWHNPVTTICVWAVMFIACYGGALICTKSLINVSKLGLLVGQSAGRRTAASSVFGSGLEGKAACSPE